MAKDQKPKVEKYIMLPPHGLRTPHTPGTESVRELFRSMAINPPAMEAPPKNQSYRVLDAIDDEGAKLVEMSPGMVDAIRAQQPAVRILPLVYYRPASLEPLSLKPIRELIDRLTGRQSLVYVKVKGGTVLANAKIQFATNAKGTQGWEDTTDEKGRIGLPLDSFLLDMVDTIYVRPPDCSAWGLLIDKSSYIKGDDIELDPAVPSFKDCLRYFYGTLPEAPDTAPEAAGRNVTVGVIDMGIDGNHPHLNVEGGMNAVWDELENDFDDNGLGHGTHVAGIIGASGQSAEAMRGLAPGVTLKSYRVYPRGTNVVSNWSLARAILRSVEEGCDLINLSLGGGKVDEAVNAALGIARLEGALPICAAGNDYHGPVCFPASNSHAVAVSAIGYIGTFPERSLESRYNKAPYGKDKNLFFAAFSNCGEKIQLTGPGVGVISTFTGGRYGVMSGTSMACAAVTGATARLLSLPPNEPILRMGPGQDRSASIAGLALQAAETLGLHRKFQGQGLIH